MNSDIKKGPSIKSGLDALFNVQKKVISSEAVLDQITNVNCDRSRPSAFQPRKQFNPEELKNLSDSIRQQGVLQPIIVRPTDTDFFEIIAGERRWRASVLAGLDTIPAIVKVADDNTVLAWALIENIQREQLNAIEEAEALRRLVDEFAITHDEVSKMVGKSRSTVTNLLRLLNLEPPVKAFLIDGNLEMGHARALLAINGNEQVEVAQQIVSKKLSVREAEKSVNKALNRSSLVKLERLIEEKALIDQVKHTVLKTLSVSSQVKLSNSGSGSLVIPFASLEELKWIEKKLKNLIS